ncbi:MAG: Gfo/Idh/MocA family oxidoreductase, partial [Armatimonadetes bacterium]|nr:Gfo/Idh/MocA family oxidoreductase [Armatimonadota bacterium]
MPDTLLCGVIGAGGFAETCHIPGLQSHPQAQVVALCGRNEANARAMADRNGIPDVYASYHELLAREEIDAVCIVTPNAAHCPIALTALEAGKHVFCEKPLSMNACEARDMEAAARRSGRVAQVAFTFRFLHGLEALRGAVRAGKIGRPYFARVRFEGGRDLHPDSTLAWRHYAEESGAGVLQDMGSHCLDLLNFALEPVTEVCGTMLRVSRARPDRKSGALREVTTDDLAGAYWRAESGLQGEFMVSRVTKLRGGNNELEVFGEEGSIRAALSRGHADTVTLEPLTRDPESLDLPEESRSGTDYALGRMMHAFADSILGAPTPGVEADFSDGR